LEGFSEDLNQDGYVDPIGQAVVPAVAPLVYTVAAAAPAAAPAAVETKEAVAPAATVPLTYAAAPIVQYAPAVYHTVQTIPQVKVFFSIYTRSGIHERTISLRFLGIIFRDLRLEASEETVRGCVSLRKIEISRKTLEVTFRSKE
jgi:hypothetical protein